MPAPGGPRFAGRWQLPRLWSENANPHLNQGANTPPLIMASQEDLNKLSISKSEDFPPLQTQIDECLAFSRGGKVTRSPPPSVAGSPLVPKPTGEMSPVKNQETPKGQTKAGSLVSPDEKNIELSQETIDVELKRMRGVLLEMQVAAGRQKNVSVVVKNGMVSLETSLVLIESFHRVWRASHQRLHRETRETETQAPSPSMLAAQAAGKRVAESSPEEQRKMKRQRDTGDPTATNPSEMAFQKVLSKKEKRKARAEERKAAKQEEELQQRKVKRKDPPKKKSKARPAAVIIKPSAGKSYSDILGTIRSSVKPADTGAEIRAVRRTRTGDVLVELGPGTKSKSDFGDALQTTLGATALVRCLDPKSTVELLDLDELTTEAEVKSVLDVEVKKSVDARIFVSKANPRGQKMALITLPVPDAETLLKKGRIKIGWVSCRVRAKLVLPRCFKCLGYGHVAGGCTGPDRSKLCFKCGSQEHQANSCKETPSCVLCKKDDSAPADYQHVPGSSRCRAYREALERQKTRRT